jgi:hypothetical protein
VRLRLRIERLVLRGVAPGDAHAVSESLRSVLARELAAGSAVQARAADRVRLGAARLEAGAGPAAVGAAAASRVAKGLRG